MRPALILLPLILTACATPREACINDVTREQRVLTQLINNTRANVIRGYAIEERQEVQVVRGTCEGKNEDGEKIRFRCDKTETFDREIAVAIDLNAERAKLESLEERLRQMQVNAAGGIQQCIAQFPE